MSKEQPLSGHREPSRKPPAYGDLYIKMLSGILTAPRSMFLGLLFFFMFSAEYLGFGPLDWGQTMILASLFASGMAFGIAFVQISCGIQGELGND